MKKKNKLEFFIPKKENGIGQWLAEEGISAGFPSPADDFKETRISLDRELVKNKEATFYARVSGDSMVGAGLDDGDLLVIDRSLNPENGKIAICLVDGDGKIEIVVGALRQINPTLSIPTGAFFIIEIKVKGVNINFPF